MKEFDDSDLPEAEIFAPKTPQDFMHAIHDRVRSAALNASNWDYEIRTDEYRRAQHSAQEVIENSREQLPEIQEPTEEALAERALTRLFFTFSNPDNPEDMPTAAQIVDLLQELRDFSPTETETTFAERLDTVSSFLYGLGQDEVAGPWQAGTTSPERYEAVYDHFIRLIGDGQTE
ncbi:MAG TPA: hypothetical protein VHT70_03760 [Candidatus Saccharimonadales bacterium]|nr:hypothetical protein [Candidatus Saccharimonadales bacterium]